MTDKPKHAQLSVRVALGGDQAAREDLLGFKPYVLALAEFLGSKNTKAPVTVSIEGKWGSGKSSFMRQLQTELDERGHLTIWFDAWRHEKEEALWASFAVQFLEQASTKTRRLFPGLRLQWRRSAAAVSPWERWRLRLLICSEVLFLALIGGAVWYGVAIIRNVIPNRVPLLENLSPASKDFLKAALELGGKAAPMATAAAAILTLARTVIGGILNLDFKKYLGAPQYRDHLTLLNQFHSDFKHIVSVYAGKRPVCVFIDDLDRCDPGRAADLMQAINLLITEDPALLFVIGMDREKIAAGIAVRYEKMIPFVVKDAKAPTAALDFGFNFLEKFVQIPFPVPNPAEADLEKLVAYVSGAEKQGPSAPGRFLVAVGRALWRTPGVVRDLFVQGWQWVRTRLLRRGEPVTALADIAVQTLPTTGAPPSAAVRRQRALEVVPGFERPELIADVVRMIAPALDRNPRRVKQCLDLFRLRAWIAERTGLFVEVMEPEPHPALTPEQLAKFVVLSLRWPDFIADAERNPALLPALQQRALGEEYEATVNAAYWQQRAELMDVLRYGCDRDVERYGMRRVNVATLLRALPLVDTAGIPFRSEAPVEAAAPAQAAAAAQAVAEATAPAVAEATAPAVAEAPAPGQRRPQTEGLRAEGDRFFAQGQLDLALDRYNEALSAAASAGDDRNMARALVSRSRVLQRLGRQRNAAENLEEAMEIFQRIGSADDQSMVLVLQGQAALGENRVDEALALYQHAAELGGPLAQANAWKGLGDIQDLLGKTVEAERCYESAMAGYSAVESAQGRANVLVARAGLAARSGRNQSARELYTEAERLYRQQGDLIGLGNALLGLAGVYQAGGEVDNAILAAREAERAAREAQSGPGQAHALQTLGDLCVLSGDVKGAEETLLRALELYRSVKDLRGEANTLTSLGIVRHRLGDRAGHRRLMEEARLLFDELPGSEAALDYIRRQLEGDQAGG